MGLHRKITKSPHFKFCRFCGHKKSHAEMGYVRYIDVVLKRRNRATYPIERI